MRFVTDALLLVVIVLGLAATIGYRSYVQQYELPGEFEYRDTIGAWFRSLFLFGPEAGLNVGAPLIFLRDLLLPYIQVRALNVRVVCERRGLRSGWILRTRGKLEEVAAARGSSVSELVRSLILRSHEEEVAGAARLAAAERIGRMEVEDVPEPAELKQQFSEAHAPDESKPR